jgi:hypothetical protein
MKKITIISLLIAVGMFSLSADHKKGHRGKGQKGAMRAKMLEKMDADKDGKISKQEWQAHHDEKFAELDADRDGAISKDEFKSHHEKMMKEHGMMGKKGMGHGKMDSADDQGDEDEKPRKKRGKRKKASEED